MNELEYCLKWFESEDLMAYIDDTSIYVVIGEDDFVQISSAEISFRAELYKSTIEE